LDEIARGFRKSRALRAKASIGLVRQVLGPTDWLSGPGDDAAAIERPGSRHVLVAGEAIWPPFVQADPHGAGVAAVVANVNDVAAMGGRPLALVDTIVGPESVANDVLRGLRETADRYGVPVVGGHLTVGGHPPAVSAFVLGHAEALLPSRNAEPGFHLVIAAALEGTMHPDFPYYSAMEARAARLASDLELLPRVAEAGWCVAAKDVSMAGLLGSLAMLLEPTGVGVTVDLERVPRPPGVALTRWLPAFPSYGFWLVAPPGHTEACVAAFRAEGLACDRVGTLDGSGELRVRLGGDERTLLDLAERSVTGLGAVPPPRS
jgi:hypothetical protein